MDFDASTKAAIGRQHAIDAELSGRHLGDIERGLSLADLARSHHEVNIGMRSYLELADQIDFRPASDTTVAAVNDCPEQFAGSVIKQPNAVQVHPHRPSID